MENILEVKDLTLIFKSSNRGVKNISFSVPKGHFHAFIGENGAGKTTTIKTIIGAHIKFKGEILIKGISNKIPESKMVLGYVPEVAIFPKELTTYEYLKAFAKLSGIKKEEIDNKITNMLERFNILDLKNDKPYSFSSGQKKKVLLIQALINEPELIILDEPSSNLDPTARYELFKILNELKHDGKTILVSSHVLTEIDKYTDSLTLINKGQIEYSGLRNKQLEDIFYEKIIKK